MTLSIEDRLQDEPISGAPSRITADQRCKIEALACEQPEKQEDRSASGRRAKLPMK
jgi:hypothetical protein